MSLSAISSIVNLRGPAHVLAGQFETFPVKENKIHGFAQVPPRKTDPCRFPMSGGLTTGRKHHTSLTEQIQISFLAKPNKPSIFTKVQPNVYRCCFCFLPLVNLPIYLAKAKPSFCRWKHHFSKWISQWNLQLSDDPRFTQPFYQAPAPFGALPSPSHPESHRTSRLHN